MQHGFIKTAAMTPEIRVADCAFNARSIIGCMARAAREGVRLLVLPELCITGYTCSDLFFQDALIRAAERALGDIARESVGYDMLVFVGTPLVHEGRLYNCAAALYRGQVLGFVPKSNIPNYNEFYEKRHFPKRRLKTALRASTERQYLSAQSFFSPAPRWKRSPLRVRSVRTSGYLSRRARSMRRRVR